MKVNINRKFAIIATIGLACVISVILVACGSKAGSDTDDTVQPKAIAATRGTTAETEATTTTTTTEVSTTSEPEIETKTPQTTTTTEVITTSEPEVTTTVDTPDETGIVTMADNPEGMYPMSECFRRRVEEFLKQEVISIDFDENLGTYVATSSQGIKVIFGKSNNGLDYYNSDELFKTTDLAIGGSTDEGYDFEVVYGL